MTSIKYKVCQYTAFNVQMIKIVTKFYVLTLYWNELHNNDNTMQK